MNYRRISEWHFRNDFCIIIIHVVEFQFSSKSFDQKNFIRFGQSSRNQDSFMGSTFNPYWQILENSSKNFPEISVVRAVTQTGFWKNHPVFFSKCQFPGHELDRFLEISSIFGWVFQKSVCVMPQNYKMDSWMNFPKIGLTHAPEICQ